MAGNFIFRSIGKADLVFFVLLLCSVPVFCGMKNDAVNVMIYAHFICYGCNNAFLIYLYRKLSMLGEIRSFIIPRIGAHKAENHILVNNVAAVLTYQLILNLFLFLFYDVIVGEWLAYVPAFLVLNTFMCFIESTIVSFAFFHKRGIALIMIAICVNMAFHYLAVPALFPA